jgi:nuclear pore complex protein Nup62
MGKDLTSMIEEINTASSTLTKTSKADDPVRLEWLLGILDANLPQLSQIVKVLNSHLSSLQWIDQNAASLQAKVMAAQKAGSGIGSDGRTLTANEDAANDFIKSFMGRR